MRPLLVHLDESLAHQPALADACKQMNALSVDALDLGPALRLWSRPKALSSLAQRLDLYRGPCLAFAGSGDFHHVTPFLLARAIAAAGNPPTTLVHFDNHPDWVRYSNGMHCGSWAAQAARQEGVFRVLTIGVCSHDVARTRTKNADLSVIEEGRLEIYPLHAPDGAAALELCGHAWPSFETLGRDEYTKLLVSRITTDAVYITIDKDVLRADDAVTNWDQGDMTLDILSGLIAALADGHDIIGADVVGDWSRQDYGGGIPGMLKRGEALLDQPWRAPRDKSVSINQAANLRLLSLFDQIRP